MSQNSLKCANFLTQKFVSSHKFDKIIIEVNQNLFKREFIFALSKRVKH